LSTVQAESASRLGSADWVQLWEFGGGVVGWLGAVAAAAAEFQAWQGASNLAHAVCTRLIVCIPLAWGGGGPRQACTELLVGVDDVAGSMLPPAAVVRMAWGVRSHVVMHYM
jgi:hypothetical protein